jgi:hypothetical protein
MSLLPFRLVASDAERYAQLRLRMLLDSPWSFASSAEDDRALSPLELAETLLFEQNDVVAVASPDGTDQLIASASIFRVRAMKSAHRAKL